MPSIITHHMFAKEVLNRLNKKTQNRINKELDVYYAFAQSHDYLFYYQLNLKYRKKINELGHYAHRHKSQEYLLNIIKEIKSNNLENNQQLVAYLYGSITHYVLDSTCHPYIFYKTGVYRKKEKDTYKYRGEHNHIEKDLDAIYYEKYTHKKLNTCNVNKEIIKNPIFTDTLINTISNVYKKTYNKDNIGYFFYKGIKHAKIAYTILINDRFGIKKFFLKIIDFITNKHSGCLANYSTYIKNPNLDYLNLNHKEWNHPSIKEIKYNYSFEDLYEISLTKTLNIINEVNKVIYKNQDISILLDVIQDLDYDTGLIIKESKQMRHFEY